MELVSGRQPTAQISRRQNMSWSLSSNSRTPNLLFSVARTFTVTGCRHCCKQTELSFLGNLQILWYHILRYPLVFSNSYSQSIRFDDTMGIFNEFVRIVFFLIYAKLNELILILQIFFKLIFSSCIP